jgi:hypothetical protein
MYITLPSRPLIPDDSSDGVGAKDELGSIRVQVHRCAVTGPWSGKLPTTTPSETKPVLVSEKSATTVGDHRVGYHP